MRKLIDPFLTLGQGILDLVFPVTCLRCGKEGEYICKACFTTLPRESIQACIRCKQPSPFGKTHPNCASRNFPDGLISCLPYKHPTVKEIIEKFKYDFVSSIGRHLAKMLTEELECQNLKYYFKDFTIIPVPLHPRRFRWRGFNQAELLAQQLAAELGVPLETDLVVRSRFTKPQVKLSAEERLKNITGAFKLTDNGSPGKYLIVDDVVTSGSTINEITKTLKKAGAQEVWAIAAARG